MENLRIEIQAKSLPPSVRALGYRGLEKVSAPYEFTLALRVLATSAGQLANAVGEPIVIETLLEGSGAEKLGGFMAAIEVSSVVDDEAICLVTVVPHLHRLALTEHSRVFVDKSVPEVVKEVLELEGLDSKKYRFEVTASYEKREHICQYRESSLAFVSRLLEREGIHYAFEHTDDGDVVVFRDTGSSPPLSPTTLHYGTLGAASSLATSRATVSTLRARRQALPAEVHVADYEPLAPARDVSAASTVLPELKHRVVTWAPNVSTRDAASRRARVLGEALRSREEVFDGVATTPAVRAGSRFSVVDHPRARLSQEYFAVSVRHEVVLQSASADIRQLAGFGAETHFASTRFEAVPATAPFRPQVATPIARVDGLVDAVIDGPATSDYAQIDNHGRYHVRVRFDEQAAHDGGASMWVRMLQPHGGSVEGHHFPLRKGTEVHLLFLGGDPDRPVIAGAAINALKPTPVSSSNASQNVIQTGGSNRLEMEDARGGQYIHLSTPTATSHLHMGDGAYQWALRTTGQGHLFTGQSLEVEVLGPKTETVASDVSETYSATQTLDVLGAFTETLHSTLDNTVLGPLTCSVTATLTETVTGSVTETYNSGQNTTVTGHTTITLDAGLTHHVTSAVDVTLTASQDTKVTGPLDLTISGATTETFGNTKRTIHGTFDVTVDAAYNLNCPNKVLHVPHVGLNISTLSRLSPFQIETKGKNTEAKAASFKMGGSAKSYTGASASAYGATIALYGSLFTSGKTFSFAGFRKEDQLLKVGLRLIAIELGPQLMT